MKILQTNLNINNIINCAVLNVIMHLSFGFVISLGISHKTTMPNTTNEHKIILSTAEAYKLTLEDRHGNLGACGVYSDYGGFTRHISPAGAYLALLDYTTILHTDATISLTQNGTSINRYLNESLPAYKYHKMLFSKQKT